jgi:hypothetical protein
MDVPTPSQRYYSIHVLRETKDSGNSIDLVVELLARGGESLQKREDQRPHSTRCTRYLVPQQRWYQISLIVHCIS